MLKTLKKDIDKEISLALKEVKKRYRLALISPQLYKGMEDFLRRDGKRIRPILFVAGYNAYARKPYIPYRKLVRMSLALEFLHDFLLVHDDIIDKSPLRRGKPALHKVYGAMFKDKPDTCLGEGLGIVAGDIMYAMAFESFLSGGVSSGDMERALRKLIEITVYTGAGEFIDVVGGSKSLSKTREKDVLLTYDLKTARYTFEGPLVMGALLAGAKKEEVKRLSNFGINVGQAFQLQDDMLDIFLSAEDTGKPALSDLAEGKKTLIAHRAYSKLKGAEKERFRRLFDGGKGQPEALLELKNLICGTDTPEYCLAMAERLFRTAEKELSGLRMKGKVKSELSVLLDGFFSAGRKVAAEIKKIRKM
jgi:geranylgeranyl diphosphate synthase type I